MAIIKIETTVTTVDDVDTGQYPDDYTIDDILEEHRANDGKLSIVDALDNDLASVTNRVYEVEHSPSGG